MLLRCRPTLWKALLAGGVATDKIHTLSGIGRHAPPSLAFSGRKPTRKQQIQLQSTGDVMVIIITGQRAG